MEDHKLKQKQKIFKILEVNPISSGNDPGTPRINPACMQVLININQKSSPTKQEPTLELPEGEIEEADILVFQESTLIG